MNSLLKKPNKMHIIIASDESYIPHAATMLCSLLENNTGSIKIFLLHDGIKNKQIKLLGKFINKYGAEFETIEIHHAALSSLKINDYYKPVNYFRLLIPEILPGDIGKALYLDTDLIVRKPIDALWNIDLNDYLLAAVEDAKVTNSHKEQLGLPPNTKYFNSGVLLINVDQWRRQSVHFKVIDFIRNNPDKISLVDQDGLNAVLYEKWMRLPLIWNLQAGLLFGSRYLIRFADIITDPAIVHFTENRAKPWQNSSLQYPYCSEYNEYRQKTPWPKYKLDNLPGRIAKRVSKTRRVFKEYAKNILRFLAKIDSFWEINRNFLRMATVVHSARGKNTISRVPQINAKDVEYIKSLIPGQTVVSGPFRGLKYPPFESIGSCIAPKLLGSYEIELREIVEEICNNNYSTIINIGCAEGYYAVGFALRKTNINVYAYDIDPKARQLCQAMAKLNGVTERVKIEELFTMRTIPKILPNDQGLIFCDCGGAEEYIFYNDGENWLQLINHFDLLIEIHDVIRPGISKYIYDLFSASHNIQIIRGVNDLLRPRIFDFPITNELSLDTKVKLMAEQRLGVMQWFYMKRKKSTEHQ
jgi:lipopolysaccharide biosynthesis glycosyltransferase